MTFLTNWKMFIMEATIPGCSIRNLFKQVWIILQVYIITIGRRKNEPWTNYPSKKMICYGNFLLPQLLFFYWADGLSAWFFN